MKEERKKEGKKGDKKEKRGQERDIAHADGRSEDSTAASLWQKISSAYFFLFFLPCKQKEPFTCEDFYYNAVKIVAAYSAVP